MLEIWSIACLGRGMTEVLQGGLRNLAAMAGI